jgi:biotin carboxyl carrier protein
VAESAQPEPRRTERAAAERAADHAAIERLTAELLPSLIVKLAATGLGELEVREGTWKVRLRRPGSPTSSRERRPTERGARTAGQASHPGIGLTPVGPGRDGRDGRDGREGHAGSDSGRIVATSPAVGIFQPRTEARHGTTIRAGDRLGVVDMLGVAQEVVSPADGVVGSSLVEPGDAVEYGQELVVIELALAPAGDA